MGLLSSTLNFTKNLLNAIEYAKKPKTPAFEFKVGEGMSSEPTKLPPGPTKAYAALPKTEPVSFVSPDASGKRIEPIISPRAQAQATVTKPMTQTPNTTLRENVDAGLLATTKAVNKIDQLKRNLTYKVVPEIAKEIARAPVKTITSIALEPTAGIISLATGKPVIPTFTPKTGFEKMIYGDKPVNGIFTTVSETQENINKLAEKLHIDKDLSLGASFALAPLFVGSMAGLDLTPIGGEKKSVEKLIAQTDNAEGVLRILQKTFKNSKEELGPLAQVLSLVDNEKDVGIALKNLTSVADDITPPSLSIAKGAKPPREILNYDRMDLADGEKMALKTLVDIKGEGALAKNSGVITHERVIKAAKESERRGEVLKGLVTEEEQIAAEAADLRVRQALTSATVKFTDKTATAAEQKEAMQELLKLAEIRKSQAQAAGRRLEANKILAQEAGESDDKIKMFEFVTGELEKNGIKLDQVAEEAMKVDWEDRKAVTDFFRQYVKPTFKEVFDDYRYNNALSGPVTQLKNLFTNALETMVIRPATLTVNAGVDLLKSAWSMGKVKPGVKIADIPKYYRDVFKAIPSALGDFSDVMKGKTAFSLEEMKRSIPSGGMFRISDKTLEKKFVGKVLKPVDNLLGSVANNKAYQKAYSFFRTPTKTLEASDKFFSRLIGDSEKARLMAGGMSEAKAAKEAEKVAEYSLFRQGIDPENKTGQGSLLSAIDRATSGIDYMRKQNVGLDWFVMFVRTPMNFAKKWIEYSPLGVATLYKNAHKQEQIAKMMIGTTVSAFGAKLAVEDKTTWSIPKDPVAQKLFFDSGKKPYSIRIGDSWVPMNYLGPLAYALALPAALKYYQEDSPTALTDKQSQKIAKGISGIAELFTTQTFVSGVDSWLQLLQGGQDRTFGKALAFNASQVIPWSGMVRYVSSIIDNTYRKSDTFLEALQKDLPFVGKNLEPHQMLTGEPSVRNMTSYLAPWAIGQEKPEWDKLLKMQTELVQDRNLLTQNDKGLLKEASSILRRMNDENSQAGKKKILGELSGKPILMNTVVQLQKEQNVYEASLIQPLFALANKPTEVAQIIYAKSILADTPEEKKDLASYIQMLARNGLWDQKTVDALSKLQKKEEEQTAIEEDQAANE